MAALQRNKLAYRLIERLFDKCVHVGLFVPPAGSDSWPKTCPAAFKYTQPHGFREEQWQKSDDVDVVSRHNISGTGARGDKNENDQGYCT